MVTKTTNNSMVDDLCLFALQTGPQTSSKVARLFGITNLEAKAMLRRQVTNKVIFEYEENGVRLFRLAKAVELDANDFLLND